MSDGLHNHGFRGRTTFNEGHTHEYTGVTSLNPDIPGHVHYILGETTFNDGHIQRYSSYSSPQVTVDGGHPRVPQNCPPAFLGRYTVLPGDTFFTIAQIFRVRIEALAVNNPHISNPNVIFPGDILCVPGLVPFPCCAVLQPRGRVPFGTGGIAYVNFTPRGGQSVSFMSTLPLPTFFGNFDIYTGEIFIPDIGGFGNQLFATPEDPPTWATRVDLPTVASIIPNSRLIIRPSNSSTGASGSIILEGIIQGGCCQSQS